MRRISTKCTYPTCFMQNHKKRCSFPGTAVTENRTAENRTWIVPVGVSVFLYALLLVYVHEYVYVCVGEYVYVHMSLSMSVFLSVSMSISISISMSVFVVKKRCAEEQGSNCHPRTSEESTSGTCFCDAIYCLRKTTVKQLFPVPVTLGECLAQHCETTASSEGSLRIGHVFSSSRHVNTHPSWIASGFPQL